MDTAFVCRWTKPFPGREKQSLGYSVEVSEYWGKLAADGKCTQPEYFFFPDGSCLWMVKGEHDVLRSLCEAKETMRLLTKGQLLLSDLSYDLVSTGPAGDEYLQIYFEGAAELGLL